MNHPKISLDPLVDNCSLRATLPSGYQPPTSLYEPNLFDLSESTAMFLMFLSITFRYSASGRAALLSLDRRLEFRPVGFLGLDPWWICPINTTTTDDHHHNVDVTNARLFQQRQQRSTTPNENRFLDGDNDHVSSLCPSKQQQQPLPLLQQEYEKKKKKKKKKKIPAIHIPTFTIGFTETTCGVDPTWAAMAEYQKTVPLHRVAYQIHNPFSQQQQQQHHPRIRHCSFTDSGCPGFTVFGRTVGCPIEIGTFDFIYQLVGYAAKQFVTAIQQQRQHNYSSFDRTQFDIRAFLPPNNVTLYVGNDAFRKKKKVVGW
jgi:hypothetical protein